MKIYNALLAVLAALSADGISKDRTNEQQRYKFRGIDDIYNAISGLFAENKILPLPRYADVVQSERETKDGKPIFVTRLNGYFKLLSLEDGSAVEIGPFPGEAMDSADKSTNKAMSASFKYALLQTFVIPTEADNDADATTHDVRARQPAAPKQPPTRQPELGPNFHGSTDNVRAGEAAVDKAQQPKNDHPLLMNLRTLLAKYGPEKAPLFATKTAEAMGVKTIEDIPVAQLPQALQKVMDHQKAAKAAKAAAATPAEGTKPATTKKAAGKKAPLPEPDRSPAPDPQEPDADDGDGIPV